MKYLLHDSTFTNPKSMIDIMKLAYMNDVISSDSDRYITAVGSTSPKSITVDGNLLVAVGDSLFLTSEVTLTESNLDTGSFTLGTDYYIYICDMSNGDPTNNVDETFVISANSSYPSSSGYTASNSRKIGGFHYGRVRNCNSQWNPINTAGTEYGSGWQTNVYIGIVPNSVWTLLHRPKCDPEGMVWVNGDLWVDIYLSSDDGADGVKSTYNSVPISGTEGLCS